MTGSACDLCPVARLLRQRVEIVTHELAAAEKRIGEQMLAMVELQGRLRRAELVRKKQTAQEQVAQPGR